MTALFGIMHEAERRVGIFEELGYEFHGKGFTRSPAPAAAAEHIVPFIENYQEDRPFFLCVGFGEPHHPWRHGECRERGVDLPGWLEDKLIHGEHDPESRKRAERQFALLQGAIRTLDSGVGAILDCLERTGRDKDTVVVFTTDHGVAMPRAKCTLFDGGIGVTLMIRNPAANSRSGGLICRDLVSNIDVLPTLLDMFDISGQAALPGRTLTPCLSGKPTGHDTVFAEKNWHGSYDPCRCVRTKTHKFIANFENNLKGGIVEGDWMQKDLYKRFRSHFELYDLTKDPFEKNNVADEPEHEQCLADMKKRLVEWMRSSDDPLLKGPVPGYFYMDTMAGLGLEPDVKTRF